MGYSDNFRIVINRVQTMQMPRKDFNDLPTSIKSAIGLCLLNTIKKNNELIGVPSVREAEKIIKHYYRGKENKDLIKELKKKYG